MATNRQELLDELASIPLDGCTPYPRAEQHAMDLHRALTPRTSRAERAALMLAADRVRLQLHKLRTIEDRRMTDAERADFLRLVAEEAALDAVLLAVCQEPPADDDEPRTS